MTILEVNRDITDLKRTLQHLRFLTEASKLLVSSLNYEEVLVQVAQRAVPMWPTGAALICSKRMAHPIH